MNNLTRSRLQETAKGRLREGNMSYCRFENTSSALIDCLRALNDPEGEMSEMSSYEIAAAKSLIATCQEIAEGFGDLDIDALVAQLKGGVSMGDDDLEGNDHEPEGVPKPGTGGALYQRGSVL